MTQRGASRSVSFFVLETPLVWNMNASSLWITACRTVAVRFDKAPRPVCILSRYTAQLRLVVVRSGIRDQVVVDRLAVRLVTAPPVAGSIEPGLRPDVLGM